ncbi:MAG: electron transport complex subunit RsxG [Nitrosomonadales bacterium]|nr:MAG: electron transport complex subunit RsxG [Nitrosomonadales bacterium]
MSAYARHSARLAMVLAAFALAGTTLLALTYGATKDNIAASEKKAKMALIAQILPPALYDNDIIRDAAELQAVPELGLAEPALVYRALKEGQPAAAVLEAIAPDGYAGKIKLLIAIKANGEISGVRVVAHKETPGLGDYIEIAKNNWIKGFDGTSLDKYPSKDWKVKKDGGQFDYMTGATVTPRAVVKAVHKALVWFSANREKIFSLPAQEQTK